MLNKDKLQCLTRILTSINELCCVLSRNTICKEFQTKPKFNIHVYTNLISARNLTSLPKVIIPSNTNGLSNTKDVWLTLFEMKFVSTFTYFFSYRVQITVLKSVDNYMEGSGSATIK